MFKDRGIDAIINDSLVSMSKYSRYAVVYVCGANWPLPALTWGAYATGLLCSLFGYLYLRCMQQSRNYESE